MALTKEQRVIRIEAQKRYLDKKDDIRRMAEQHNLSFGALRRRLTHERLHVQKA